MALTSEQKEFRTISYFLSDFFELWMRLLRASNSKKAMCRSFQVAAWWSADEFSALTLSGPFSAKVKRFVSRCAKVKRRHADHKGYATAANGICMLTAEIDSLLERHPEFGVAVRKENRITGRLLNFARQNLFYVKNLTEGLRFDKEMP